MQSKLKSRWAIPAILAMIALCAGGLLAADDTGHQPHYLITDNDASPSNSASFYVILEGGTLRSLGVVPTRGSGVNGIGSVATKRLSVLDSTAQQCAYVSDAGSADVAGISIKTFKATGTFKAKSTDSAPNGMAVVNNGTYVYATFTGSNTIGTYRIISGCKLDFLGDISAAGLKGGSAIDMQIHGDILVVSFQDGSIESFNVAKGLPKSNDDLQYSTGNTQDGNVPSGVDISRDGHFAIFGGTLTPAMVEVSDISSGKLAPTVVYSAVGDGYGSQAIWLSPGGELLYLSNYTSNAVTAATFNEDTGAVSEECMGTFRGTGYFSGLATARQTGTGGTIYVVEADQGIGFATITKPTGTCSIEEESKSPETTPFSSTVESATSFPPRPF